MAGLAVGVALGVLLLSALGLFFAWRRLKQRNAEQVADSMNPETGAGGTPGTVSRHTSQMSQHGLIGKAPVLNTRNLSGGLHSTTQSAANISPGSGNRRSLGADQRLDPYSTIYANEAGNASDISLQDNADYSRKILSVRNRGPGETEDE